MNDALAIGDGSLKEITERIKAPLNSLRSMSLYLTDSDGNAMTFRHEFVMMITVSFDID